MSLQDILRVLNLAPPPMVPLPAPRAIRRGNLRFEITGIAHVPAPARIVEKLKALAGRKIARASLPQAVREIKSGEWRDTSRYPGHVLRALRAARGCGKRRPV